MRMNSGQKVIVCVALGAAAVVLGLAARAQWFDQPSSGWFNYAPNNGVVFTDAGPDTASIVRQALVWLGGVAAWAALCLYALRDRTARPAQPRDEASVSG